MGNVVSTGLVRPPQIDKLEHTMKGVHQYYEREMNDAGQEAWLPKKEEMWNVRIKCSDKRLTDLIARLISGVLFTNSVQLQNAEENVLRERGVFIDIPRPEEKLIRDITQEQASEEQPSSAVGNG